MVRSEASNAENQEPGKFDAPRSADSNEPNSPGYDLPSTTESRIQARIAQIVQKSAGLDEDDVEQIATLLQDLVQFDRLSVSMFDAESGVLTYGPAYGLATTPPGTRLTIDPDQLLRDYKDSNIKLFDSEAISKIPSRFPGANNLLDLGVQSMISVALRWDGNVLGFFTLMSSRPEAFDASQGEMLSRLSGTVSAALATSELANERMAYLETSANLTAIAGRLVESLIEDTSIEKGLTEFARELAQELAVDMVSLSALGTDRSGNYQMYGFEKESGVLNYQLSPQQIPFVVEDLAGISNTVIASLDQLLEHRDKFARVDQLLDQGYVQLSITPLRWRGEHVGWITTWNRSKTALPEALKRSLDEVAGSIASSIGYIQINQKLEDDYQIQSAISEMSNALSSSESFEAGLESLASGVFGLLHRGRPVISVYDGEPLTITDYYSYTPGRGLTRFSHRDLLVPVQINELEVSNKAAHVPETRMREVAAEFSPFAEAIADGYSELAAVRMRWQGELVGSLAVYYEPSDPFQEHDLELLDRIASGISGAIGTLLLNQELTLASEIDSLIAEIGQAASSAHTLDNAFTQLVPLLNKLVQFDELRITVVDIESGTLTMMFDSDEDELEMRSAIPRNLPGTHTALVLGDTDPVRITIGSDTESDFDHPRIIEPNERGFRSAIGVQLVSDGVPFGALLLRSKTTDAFSDVSNDLMWRISDEISGSIAYHRVNEQLASEVREQTALSRIGRIIGSELEIESVFDQVAEELAGLIKFDAVMVTMPNTAQTLLRNLVVSGPKAENYHKDKWFENQGSIVAETLDTNEPVRRSALDAVDPAKPNQFRTSKELGIRSALSIPMVSEGSGFAVLQFRSIEDHAYDDLRDEFLMRIAAQMAGAIAYDRVNTRLEMELREQTSLSEIGRLLGASNDINSVFDEIADEIYQIIKFDAVWITTIDAETKTFENRFVAGSLSEDIRRTPSRFHDGTIHHAVFTTENPVRGVRLLENLREDSVLIPRMIDYFNTAFAVPLLNEGAVVGALQLRSSDPDAFPHTITRFLTLVADQISGAMARADLATNQLILGLERERAQGLESQNEDLQRLQDVREQFLGMVTHELRTPLTSISAFTDILGHNRENTLTERQLQQLNAVSRNASHLSELIDDLIHMSRMERGQFELVLSDTDVIELVDQVCESMTPVIQHRGQEILVDKKIDSLVVSVDQSRFTQVINNLISNASKFSPDDSQILVNMARNESELRISVSDEGPGIEPREAEAVFDPFYRIDNDSVRSVPGTGLGLYVARNIVRQLGGDIVVDNGSTPGSTLLVTLPLS